MKIKSFTNIKYAVDRRKRDDYYLEFVEKVYDRFGRDGLCRLINVVDVINEIKIQPNVDKT